MSSTVQALRQQRCFHHPQREASARCPECKHYYCRECITEHDDRVICASCLAKMGRAEKEKTKAWAFVPRLALALLSAAVIFIAILLMGNALLSIPSQFHHAGGW